MVAGAVDPIVVVVVAIRMETYLTSRIGLGSWWHGYITGAWTTSLFIFALVELTKALIP
jgi:hypothetical protein